MKQVLAFIFSSFFSLNVSADIVPIAALDAPLASKTLLLDITTVGHSKLVAVGHHGNVLLSTDGFTWQQAKVASQATLTGVFFLDDTLGWAVGHDSTILHSNDGGNSWEIQQFLPYLEKPLFDIAFKNENEGVAIGAYGQFFRTVDGGKHWTFEFHQEFLFEEDIEYLNELKAEDEEAYQDEISSILPHFNRILMDGRTLYLVGEIGLIAKSNDFGQSWEKLDEIYQGSFFDISRTNQGNLLVVGLRGNVYRSLTNGTPWQASETHTTSLLNSIIVTDDERVLIIGSNGMLLESSDDGATFSQHIQDDGKILIAGVWFKNKLVAVSDVGIKNIEVKK